MFHDLSRVIAVVNQLAFEFQSRSGSSLPRVMVLKWPKHCWFLSVMFISGFGCDLVLQNFP